MVGEAQRDDAGSARPRAASAQPAEASPEGADARLPAYAAADGGPAPWDAARDAPREAPLQAPAVAYRIDTLQLVAPRISETPLMDMTETFNIHLRSALGEDVEPADGWLDLSLVLAFDDLSAETEGGQLDLVPANCTHPAESTACGPTPGRLIAPSSYTEQSSGSCMDIVLDPAPSNPADEVNVPSAPCFSTAPATVTLSFAAMSLELDHAVLAARYGDQSPPERLLEGVLVGFLPKSRSDAIMVDRRLRGSAFVPSPPQPFSTLIAEDALATGPEGEPGYYMYFNFEAGRVAYTP